MSKAKEFESFRQMPKYTHKELAVIHPSPTREMRDIWKPDRHLNFDGETLDLMARRYEQKAIAEHLVRPPIDEEVLMKLRTMSAKKEVKKNLSIQEKREMKAEHKRKTEINIRIKKAEKNIKEFFAHCKKILEKDNEELVVAECGSGTVEQAKFYETKHMYIRFLYAVSVAHGRQKKGDNNKEHNHRDTRHIVFEDYDYNVTRQDFVQYMRFYNPALTEQLASDIFMYLNKRLQAMLVAPRPSEDDFS